MDDTRENCSLGEGEYFWFDIIGCSIQDVDGSLGVIEDIQRMGDTDYFVIKTDKDLVESGLSNNFLLPYIDRYIVKADIEAKCVYTKDAKDILEAS